MNRRNAVALLTSAGIAAPFARLRAASDDIRSYGMAPGAAPETNSAALQACLADNAGRVVMIPGADYEYPMKGRIAVPAGTTIVLGDGARLRWVATEPGSGSKFLRSATQPGLEVMGDGFRLTGRGQILGPSRGVYVPLETGLLCVGAGRDAIRRGFEVSDGVEFRDWGSYGIAAQYVQDVRVRGVSVRDCGYGGMVFLSCIDGEVVSNRVGAIGPGTSGNAYGISFTHDSFNYSADPSAAIDGRRAANPFCINFLVAHNVVHDVPLWAGIAFHGAFDCRAHSNQVYNCRHGLVLQGSSGAAVDFAGENNSVVDNAVTTGQMNGGPTTVTAVPRLGISVNGGKLVHHRAISVKNNLIDGYGDSQHTSFSLQHTFTSNVEIAGNRVTRWRGYGCYSAYSDGVIGDNDFGAIGEPGETACIFVAIGGRLQISGNRHVVPPQGAARYGIYLNSPVETACRIRQNDFRSATLRQYAGPGGGPMLASQIVGAAS